MGFSLQKQTAAFQQFLLADPLKACALCLVTLMPLFLLLGRVLADGAMIAVGLLFLAIQVQQGRGFPATLRALPRWFVYALGVWVFWLAVSALAVEPASSFKVAGAWIRFPLFALAVSSWVLTAEADRRRLLWVAAAAAVFLIGYGWIEFYMGYNPLRPHREFHSRLTGPFSNPLVGAYLAKVAFPVIGLLLTLPLIRQKKWGLAVPLLGILAGISTIIMAGDRIPLALSLMGVGLLALGLPQFRKVAVVGGVLVAIVGGILALNSQAVAVRVDKTVQQLSHFWESPYGLIYSNAFEMAQEKPLLGYGLSGYRAVCPVFAESRGRDKKLVCNLHPHNTYLEWGTEGGLVGLAIFLGLVGMWGVVFARGLWVAEAPVYPLVLAAVIPVFLYLWPIQSSMSFFSNQNATMFWFVLAQALAWTSRPRQAV